jgi:hypothetical protein
MSLEENIISSIKKFGKKRPHLSSHKKPPLLFWIIKFSTFVVIWVVFLPNLGLPFQLFGSKQC